MTQNDLFGATSTNPLVGLAARLPDRPCRQCGSVDATIESIGRGPHHGSLRCACGKFRGWLRKETYDFVTATTRQFGKPVEPIEIHTNSPKAGE
jgi:hypothetical protein